MILVQHFNGTQLGAISASFMPQIDDVLRVDGKRYLVHWVKHTRAGIEVGVEDITPSGGCVG